MWTFFYGFQKTWCFFYALAFFTLWPFLRFWVYWWSNLIGPFTHKWGKTCQSGKKHQKIESWEKTLKSRKKNSIRNQFKWCFFPFFKVFGFFSRFSKFLEFFSRFSKFWSFFPRYGWRGLIDHSSTNLIPTGDINWFRHVVLDRQICVPPTLITLRQPPPPPM